MKISIITVSAREGSNSKHIAQVFKQQIQTKHDKIEIDDLDLTKANIQPYVEQLDANNPKYPKDDFENYIQKIMHADAVVIFVPCYWFSHPSKLQVFMERFSQALRQFSDFKDKMRDKLWCVSVVSGAEPQQQVIHECHREICSYLNMKFLAGPWFVAYEANELEKNCKDALVNERIADFVTQIHDNFPPCNDLVVVKMGFKNALK